MPWTSMPLDSKLVDANGGCRPIGCFVCAVLCSVGTAVFVTCFSVGYGHAMQQRLARTENAQRKSAVYVLNSAIMWAIGVLYVAYAVSTLAAAIAFFVVCPL